MDGQSLHGLSGIQASSGALGEYNGKFMSGQIILRAGDMRHAGGSCACNLPQFFPPGNTVAIYRDTFSKLKDFRLHDHPFPCIRVGTPTCFFEHTKNQSK